MKKLTSALVVPFILLAVLSSCNDYPEGPKMSLKTRKARAANTWVIESVTEGDVDRTSAFNGIYTDYTLTTEKDGKFTQTFRYMNSTPVTENGTWRFAVDKTHLIFTINGSDDDWKILRLKEKELWARTYTFDSTNGSRELELHLKEK
jgi:hypothetical protein